MRTPVLLATILSLLSSSSVFAQPHFEIGAGLSLTRDEETTSTLALAWLPLQRDVRGGMLHGDIGAIHIRGRHHSRYNNAAGVSILHGGIRYERANGLIIGFGAGVQHGRTDALSGDPQFISSIGWRWNHVSLMLRHISNASLHKPNEGENILQAAWRF